MDSLPRQMSSRILKERIQTLAKDSFVVDDTQKRVIFPESTTERPSAYCGMKWGAWIAGPLSDDKFKKASTDGWSTTRFVRMEVSPIYICSYCTSSSL